MSIKPRYSLLTLLLLTAGIAVGVKLWRGPHHAVVSNPMTADESALFSDLAFSDSLAGVFAPVVYEYEYVNEWNNQRVLYVRGHSTNARPIPVHLSTNDPERGFLLRDPQPTPLLLVAEGNAAKRERVVCWIYPTKAQDEIEVEPVTYGYGSSLQTTHPTAATRCYFLSSQKKIYVFEGLPYIHIPFKHLELNDLEDPEFRACIARELAMIPEPR